MHEIPSIQDFPDRWNMVLFHPAPVPDARLAMLQRLRSLGRPRNCAARKKPEEGWDPIAPWWFHGDECCGHLKVKFPPSQPKNPSYGWNGRCRSTSSKGTLLCSPRNKTCKELYTWNYGKSTDRWRLVWSSRKPFWKTGSHREHEALPGTRKIRNDCFTKHSFKIRLFTSKNNAPSSPTPKNQKSMSKTNPSVLRCRCVSHHEAGFLASLETLIILNIPQSKLQPKTGSLSLASYCPLNYQAFCISKSLKVQMNFYFLSSLFDGGTFSLELAATP